MLKILKYFFVTLLALIVIVLVYVFSPGFWHRWISYPRLQRQVNALEALRKSPPSLTNLHTYRGGLHIHSYWSHDSEGTLASIIPAAKNAGIDFLFLTDHAHGNIDSFPRGYKGYYDGVLVEPGTERQGFCTWPLDSTVIDWTVDKDTIVKNVVSSGGMLFYTHSEEEHNWGNPYYQGMDIYNIHADTKDESLAPHIFNFIVNGSKYRPWAMREMFDEQTSIIARWDSLNRIRRIVGFCAEDAHENQNFRARYLKDGRVQWVGPNAKPIDTVDVTFRNRWMFDSPDDEGWIFKFMIDTYETSFNYVTNYVLADTLSLSSLVRHMKKGNLFIAFKSLGDAKGFMYCSKDGGGNVSGILGDSVRIDDAKSFVAVSPLPGKFKLIHNGKVLDTSAESEYEYHWSGPVEAGVYRVEVRLRLNGDDVPWIYSNPIYVY